MSLYVISSKPSEESAILSLKQTTGALETGTSLIYRELADSPVEHVSDIQMLQLNIEALKDLSDRFGFLTREVKYQLSIK